VSFGGNRRDEAVVPMGKGWSAEQLSYEAPSYYGMACAAFTPAP
jgi:hypothetical protein